jgi:hypothetical protein
MARPNDSSGDEWAIARIVEEKAAAAEADRHEHSRRDQRQIDPLAASFMLSVSGGSFRIAIEIAGAATALRGFAVEVVRLGRAADETLGSQLAKLEDQAWAAILDGSLFIGKLTAPPSPTPRTA